VAPARGSSENRARPDRNKGAASSGSIAIVIKTLQNAGTDQKWARLRLQHQEQMLARAQTRRATLEPPLYGQ
jgi:hypothetical protein